MRSKHTHSQTQHSRCVILVRRVLEMYCILLETYHTIWKHIYHGRCVMCLRKHTGHWKISTQHTQHSGFVFDMLCCVLAYASCMYDFSMCMSWEKTI